MAATGVCALVDNKVRSCRLGVNSALDKANFAGCAIVACFVPA